MSNMILAEVKTGLEKLNEITDPTVLSDLLDQWERLKPIGAALEKKVKGIIETDSECGSWHYEYQDGNRKIIDADQAELIAATIMSAGAINKCKELKLGELEKAFIEQLCIMFGCSKKEAEAEFGKRFAEVIRREAKAKKVLTRKKPSLSEAIESATINPEF